MENEEYLTQQNNGGYCPSIEQENNNPHTTTYMYEGGATTNMDTQEGFLEHVVLEEND